MTLFSTLNSWRFTSHSTLSSGKWRSRQSRQLATAWAAVLGDERSGETSKLTKMRSDRSQLRVRPYRARGFRRLSNCRKTRPLQARCSSTRPPLRALTRARYRRPAVARSICYVESSRAAWEHGWSGEDARISRRRFRVNTFCKVRFSVKINI